eukprot:scaffold8065_cov267-Pinguiococcus_pyrenoidosus.AAC.9
MAATGADIEPAVAVQMSLSHERARGQLLRKGCVSIVAPQRQLIRRVGRLKRVAVGQRHHKRVSRRTEAHTAESIPVIQKGRLEGRTTWQLRLPVWSGDGSRRIEGALGAPLVLPEVELSQQRRLPASRRDGKHVTIRMKSERHDGSIHFHVGDAGSRVTVPDPNLMPEAPGS